MKKSIRNIMAVYLSVFMAASMFAGCAKTADSSKTQKTANDQNAVPKKQVNLKFWFSYNLSVMEDMVKKYNQENKDNVQVEFTVKADKAKDVINMAFTAGESPDIFPALNVDTCREFIQKGYLEDLAGYITPEFKATLLDSAFIDNFNVYNGKIYTLPSKISTRKMLYNADLFKKAGLDPEKPPKTMQDLKEYAKKITDAGQGKQYGFSLSMGTENSAAFHGVTWPGSRSFGVLNGYDFKKGTFDFSVYKPIMQILSDMFKEKIMFPGSMTLKSDQELMQFTSGNIGMIVTGGGNATRLGQEDLKYNFDLRVADVPYFGDKPQGKITLEAPTGFAISAQSKYKKESFNFMKWLESEEIAGTITAESGEFWYNKAIYSGTKYKCKNEIAQKFAPTDNYGLYPPIPGGLVLESDPYGKVLTSIMLGAVDIDKGLKDVSDRYNKALEKTFTDGVNKKADYTLPNFDALKIK